MPYKSILIIVCVINSSVIIISSIITTNNYNHIESPVRLLKDQIISEPLSSVNEKLND